jgi:hypothetical protein
LKQTLFKQLPLTIIFINPREAVRVIIKFYSKY